MAACLKAAKSLGKGQRCVVILPDSIRNYMTKFLDDDWMIDKGFMEVSEKQDGEYSQAWATHTVNDLALEVPLTIEPNVSLGKAVELMQRKGFDQLPVCASSGQVLGVVTEGNIAARLPRGDCELEDAVSGVMYRDVARVTPRTTLAELSAKFNRWHFALVTSTQTRIDAQGEENTLTVVQGVVTRIDLLEFINKFKGRNGGEAAEPSPAKGAAHAA